MVQCTKSHQPTTNSNDNNRDTRDSMHLSAVAVEAAAERKSRLWWQRLHKCRKSNAKCSKPRKVFKDDSKKAKIHTKMKKFLLLPLYFILFLFFFCFLFFLGNAPRQCNALPVWQCGARWQHCYCSGCGYWLRFLRLGKNPTNHEVNKRCGEYGK